MSCVYPAIEDNGCAGEAVVAMNDHFKWIDYKISDIVASTEKIATSINSLQSIIPTVSYLQSAIDGVSGVSRIEAFQNSLTTFPNLTCCYGKPLTLFYPYEVYSKADYDAKIARWINANFDPSDESCTFNELYIIAFKGYEDEKQVNRNNMLLQNYEPVFNVEKDNERFIVGRFYRSGYPILTWNASPTLSPFACANALKTKIDICKEIEPVTVFYYKFSSCTIPGLVFYSAQDFNYLIGLGAVLDGYPNDIFLVSRVTAANQVLTNTLSILLVTKSGCGDSCYLLTNEFGESIVSTSKILDAYACKTSVELEGFTGTWTVEKTTDGCDCACIVTVSKANVDIYRLTNCCAAFLPCPDVQIANLPTDIWVYDNTGKNYLQAGKAVELEAYPGIRWSISIEQFNNQKITADYKVVDLFENCKAFVKPNPKPKTYFKLIGSCLNTFRTDLFSESDILTPYVGKVVNINFDTRNYYLVTEFVTDNAVATTVNIVDVNLYGNNFPEFATATRVVNSLITNQTTFEDVSMEGAEYYPSPAPSYTNKPFPTCVRRFTYWNDISVGSWVKNSVENHSKLLDAWHEADSWYSFSNDQLSALVKRSLGLSDIAAAAYLAANNLFVEIDVTFKRYRKLFRPSLSQLYGEVTDSIGQIDRIKIYSATVSTIASFNGLVSCGTVYRLVDACSGASICAVDGAGALKNVNGKTAMIQGSPKTVSSVDAGSCTSIIFLAAGQVGASMSSDEAAVYCLPTNTTGSYGTPVEFKDESCNPIILYQGSDDRYYYNAETTSDSLVSGLYLDESQIYRFSYGLKSAIGPHCCNSSETYATDCCLEGETTVWPDPEISGKVHDSVEGCNRAQETGGCTSVDGVYIKPDEPCAQYRVVDCMESILDPFHCFASESYSDCDGNNITLYKDRSQGNYWGSKEEACKCEGAPYENPGPLGLGSPPTDGDGYSFSGGVRSENTTPCGGPCICSNIDNGLIDLFDCSPNTLADPQSYTVPFAAFDTRMPCTNFGSTITCGTKCRTDGSCCQDLGYEDSPLPEWGDDWSSFRQYCGNPLDKYVDCYQYKSSNSPSSSPETSCCQDYGYEDSPLAEWGSDYSSVNVYCPNPIDDYMNCYQYKTPCPSTSTVPSNSHSYTPAACMSGSAHCPTAQASGASGHCPTGGVSGHCPTGGVSAHCPTGGASESPGPCPSASG